MISRASVEPPSVQSCAMCSPMLGPASYEFDKKSDSGMLSRRVVVRRTYARQRASYIINRYCAQQRTRERSSFTVFRKDLAMPIYSLYYRIDEVEFS